MRVQLKESLKNRHFITANLKNPALLIKQGFFIKLYYIFKYIGLLDFKLICKK